MKCEVLRCRHSCEISCLGAWLCWRHWTDHCAGKDLNLRKGKLVYRNGCSMVVRK